MARKQPSRGLKVQIDQQIAELDSERARLVAAREALERDKPPRLSQDDIAAYLQEHPGSTYTEIAEGLKALPRNIAAHLNRGKTVGRFQSDGGKWTVREGKL